MGMGRLRLLLSGGVLVAILGAGATSDRILAGQMRQQGAKAREAASEEARLVSLSVRAAVARLEQQVAVPGGALPPDATGDRLALPASARAPRIEGGRYASRPRDELATLLGSRAVTDSGLPEAALAAIALGIPERTAEVAARLLAGELPVEAADVTGLASELGVGGDPRVATLLARLEAAPPPASLAPLPAFSRRMRGAELEGWSRDATSWIHYRVPAARLLALAGVASRAALGAAGEGESSHAVPDVDDLQVRVPIGSDRRLALLRAGLWAAIVSASAGTLLSLVAMRREAVALARERAFLASVTHELRTPLASIRALGETLEAGRGEPAEYGALVARESERLESLVEHVLAATRIDEAPSFAAVAPADVVRSALEVVRERASRRGVAIDVEVPPGLPEARWDADAVRRALYNLLDNAIVHGRENGRVAVRASEAASTIRIAVSDDGPGIQRRDQPRIFGRFQRGTTQAPGTGLGLHLVEQVARSHDGRVDLETEPGRGATFTLVLPIAPSGATGATA